ncbi:P-loop containing nucleoside triphosphate hydrolase protein [Piedraia hortae CBS 480.64]|uniref:P-loop containing nucleoside triphosphate hydrolase protein n=1 Tax=Piedraia hortae CBS 480.64 TaxID=1314780 RepID=A0A6A7C3P1_9PEZI|nr:P-loop containing nucleoside triphosphate hydrolase protein [Piedraia hortae CBS 480.64]
MADDVAESLKEHPSPAAESTEMTKVEETKVIKHKCRCDEVKEKPSKKMAAKVSDKEGSADDNDSSDSYSEHKSKHRRSRPSAKLTKRTRRVYSPPSDSSSEDDSSSDDSSHHSDSSSSSSSSAKRKKQFKKSSHALDYKRVDQVWDPESRSFKFKESVKADKQPFSEYAFLVTRMFSLDGECERTQVQVKSMHLRSMLREIMKDCRATNLEAMNPSIEPNVLFLYLEDFREHYKTTLPTRIQQEKSKKAIKRLKRQRALTKNLVSYLDKDYETTKRTLNPLLKAGKITFDLLWALYKTGETVVAPCYGDWEHPFVLKVLQARRCQNMEGYFYRVEGTCQDYDGKAFGEQEMVLLVEQFVGTKEITSLSAYPLKYNQNQARLRKDMIERGQRFVELEGMRYKVFDGIAYRRVKQGMAKLSVRGRIMVDPLTFRRMNAGYVISSAKKVVDYDSYEEYVSDSEAEAKAHTTTRAINGKSADSDCHKYKYQWLQDDKGKQLYVAVMPGKDGDASPVSSISDSRVVRNRHFTEEQLLMTNPVVLGYSFSIKQWMEFPVACIQDIVWSTNAFDSLVLPSDHKEVIRALVECHKHNTHRAMDDIVIGKGKGLVAVLHGPPGTGKTLTAESISELLQCPLYMVSAGELGMEPDRLEAELQNVLDVSHAWGAILLLDEADVFLAQRETFDIRRNALVSVFLRLLEYFQGILFLTTNRVETFDEAFQSRIHLPLRYGELTTQAKRSVWKTFLDLARKAEPELTGTFTDQNLDDLARRPLNGRQIKNAVLMANALALNEKKPMGMDQLKKVLDMSESFDIRGGSGFNDAMRSYA